MQPLRPHEPGAGNVVPPGGRTVVAWDGSTAARQALEWAADEAEVRDSLLRIVPCCLGAGAADRSSAVPRRLGIEDTLDSLCRSHPTLKVETATWQTDPTEALTAGLTMSDLLVVGADGRGTARSWLQASVPRGASRRSICPVVIVRGVQRPVVRRILVGIDSSSASVAAADWACREADIHGAELIVVHGWRSNSPPDRSLRARHLARSDLRCALELVVRRCRQRTQAPVIGELIDGEPAAVLVEASADFDLVSIGSRGRSGFKTALFGSVAFAVAEHAQCPVAISHPQMHD